MGEKLAGFFTEADRIGGMVARMRLASITRVTSTQANTLADSADLVARFEGSLARIKAETATDGRQPSATGVGKVSLATGASADAKVLRKHVATYLDLMSQRALFLGDVGDTIRRVNEAAASTLDVARVSVWFLDDKATKISCADLFERSGSKHSKGVELFAKDFPTYFTALGAERTIAAHDAHTDPRTACFSEPYLRPLGINSMLDVPIWYRDKMAGVVCHEHVGPARTWAGDEETFAYLMANFVALAMERAAR